MTSRRAFLLGLTGALAAPAIVRAGSLMKLWVPSAPEIIRAWDIGAKQHIYPGDLITFVREEDSWKVVTDWSTSPTGVYLGGDKVLLHGTGNVRLPGNVPNGSMFTVARTA